MSLASDLARQSREVARSYVALVEDLRREGVPEEKAREEARTMVVLALLQDAIPDEEEPEAWER
ncbi:MAG: hypothetical protein ACLFWG_00010 [Longimicrobiales bacterium]